MTDRDLRLLDEHDKRAENTYRQLMADRERIGVIQEHQWRKEMFVEEIIRKAANEEPFHQVITQEIARQICEERSGVMMWLYSYFSTLDHPMCPLEFFYFWDSLDDIERTDFAMYAIRNMH